MSEPNERDREVARMLYDRPGNEVWEEDIVQGVAAYREEIEAHLAPAPASAREDEALAQALETAYDFKKNDTSTCTRGAFDVWKVQTLAALRSRQSPPPKFARCWWNEGGRCYVEPVIRDTAGRSTKIACCPCDQYKAKREMLESVIPGDRLGIMSEMNGETGRPAATPQPSPQEEEE